MSISEEVELLRKVPLFGKIDPARLKLLAFTSERLAYREGQLLCRQGDAGDSAFIIIDGEAEVIVAGPGDSEIAVARLGKGDVLGEIAILCDVPRTASVRAVTPLSALCISKDLFFQLVKDFPDIAIEIMRELAQRLERTTAQLREARAAAGD